MAYTDWKQLASGTQVHSWGSSGKIKFDAKYRYERNGTSVKYNIYLELYKNSSSYFNDNINLTVNLDGTEVAYIHPFKSGSSWPAVLNSEFTVSDKTTGTTSCVFNLWDASGTKEFDKYFTYYLEVPPAGSDLTGASCNTAGTATLIAKKYSGDFRDDWFINDINDQIRLDTWSYSGAAGDYTQTRNLSKDTIALLASQQNTTSPKMKVYLQSFKGTTGLGLQSKEFTASLTKSTGYIASATIDQVQNGDEVLHFYVNISKYSTSHIINRLTLYATDSSNNYRYQIYQGNVTNDTQYEVADATAIQTLFDYAGNNNSVYLYGVIDSYVTDSTYTVYIGQSAMSMYTVNLGSKTIVGTCSITELNTNLNTFKASGMENQIFFSRLSSVKYNMSANQQNYSGKTKIYGQDIGFYADNSLISNPYTRNNITSLPTIKAAVGRSVVSQATLTPTGTTLVPYNYPSLIQQNIRCDDQGATAQTGNYIKLTIQASFTDLSNETNLQNLGTATVSYTITDSDSTATGTVTSNLGNITIITKGNATSGFNYRKAATITINFVDQLGNTISTITDTVQPGRPGMYGWKTNDGVNHTTINDELNVDGKITNVKSIEVSNTTPYIDFHHNNSSNDYTSRIIENSSGNLTMENNLGVNGTISATSSLITTGNDTGVICDNGTVGRKTKYTVSGGGRAGIYDMTNSSWIIQSETNQDVAIPHHFSTGAGTEVNLSDAYFYNGRNNDKYNIISAATESIYLRPNGRWSGTGQTALNPNGNLTVSGSITSNGKSVPVMKELYSNTTGSQSVNIGESTNNYNLYIITWGIAIDEKRSDVFIPNFQRYNFTQIATKDYWSVYEFNNSGNNITMTFRIGQGWSQTAKIYKIIGVKF